MEQQVTVVIIEDQRKRWMDGVVDIEDAGRLGDRSRKLRPAPPHVVLAEQMGDVGAEAGGLLLKICRQMS